MGNQQPGPPGGPPTGDDPRHQRNRAGGVVVPPGAYGGYPVTPGPGGVGGGYPSGQQQHQQHQQQQARRGSDASMTLLDAERTAAAVAASEAWIDDDTVPTVFRWEHGGRQVYITGTFNGWSRQIPMHRSGNDFTYIHNLKRGKHAFKFIVDDEWRFAPDQPTVADIEGRINNFIDVTDFMAYTGDREFEKEKAAAEYGYSGGVTAGGDGSSSAEDPANRRQQQQQQQRGGETSTTPSSSEQAAALAAAAAAASNQQQQSQQQRPDQDGEVFSRSQPDLDDFTKEPPPLPPHLRHIILNKPPQLQDTAALPVPQHVALNHLYCTAIRDNMMVLGITQRYKTKFVTSVYYSPCASK